MDRASLYREQAAYCAYLLRRAVEPHRRAQLERERQDWLMLADRQMLWRELEEADGPGTGSSNSHGLRSASAAV